MTQAEELLTASAPDLLAYFRRRVPGDRAPDLLAETLATAWRRAAILPADPESARRWLFGIAHNVLLNDARSQRRQTRVADRLRDHLTGSNEVPADHGLEVRDALSRLEPRLAEIVRLVHWDGFSLAESAEIVGRPASTVRNEYSRAKAALREALLETIGTRAPAN